MPDTAAYPGVSHACPETGAYLPSILSVSQDTSQCSYL